MLHKFEQRLEGTRTKRLKHGHTQPGDCVSADHYISAVPGRLFHTYGRERQGFEAGTLFVDHASGKVFNYCQYSTTANETVQSKHKLEHLARDEGFKVKSYHSDNGIFASAEFKADCQKHDQKIDFSGVGAQHQNGVAEQNIKTIASWARANLLHSSYHWP